MSALGDAITNAAIEASNAFVKQLDALGLWAFGSVEEAKQRGARLVEVSQDAVVRAPDTWTRIRVAAFFEGKVRVTPWLAVEITLGERGFAHRCVFVEDEALDRMAL